MKSVFRDFARAHGELADLGGGELPSRLSYWCDAELDLRADGTHFGLVYSGTARIVCASGAFDLGAGMYFSAPNGVSISGGEGVVMTRVGWTGVFLIGGPIEASGRLHYIDGCTDSLLIPPVACGDPCLNLLHIPPGTYQSRHTHPSIRLGMILRGHGRCGTSEGETALAPGMVFAIAADGLHGFATDDEALLVLAWHPDSDFGPTDEDHPMRNRTILPVGNRSEGTRAS